MQPKNRNLAQALVTMYGAKSPATRARAENMIFDEQVDPARQQTYEAGFAPPLADYRSFLAAHRRYVKKAVYIEKPETFEAANQMAAQPALSNPIAGAQLLVRIECLDFALTHLSVGSVADLEHCRAVYRKEIGDPQVSEADAKQMLEKVCISLNGNPNAVRPRFAAFRQDVADDIDTPDWALRLRDRLGLPHYPSTKRFGPHPVALMCYSVDDVVEKAVKLGLPYAAAVPTVLDAEPYEVFHPAPREATYGRTLNLAGSQDCDRLASEILHPRIDYKPSHILKIGTISTKAELGPARLKKLREDHLCCLQLLSGRDDFGRV